MAAQGSIRSRLPDPHEVGPLQEIFPPRWPLSRWDTQSTTSSGSPPVVIPPGFYSLRLHGNCPRCHHLHKAAAIRIRMSGDSSYVSPIRCEKCRAPWIAVGGNSSTTLSLLSTQTIDLDPTDTGFRSALVDMLRSLAAVGSPAALASVPEHCVDSDSRSTGREDRQNSPVLEPYEHAHASAPNATACNREDYSPTKSKRVLLFLSQLKERFDDRFLAMKNLRLKRRSRIMKVPKISDKKKGKLPVLQPPTCYRPTQAGPIERSASTAPLEHIDARRKDEQEAFQKAFQVASIEAAGRVECNKEKLKAMSHEERTCWIREQMSDFKCRCPRDCHCRRISTHTDVSSHLARPTSSTLSITPQYLAQHRRSTDLIGIGFNFEGFNNVHSRPLSIDSITRLSQSPTLASVDSVTTASRPIMPFLSASSLPQQRQRSRSQQSYSLPIASVPMSHLREQLRHNDDERRSSVDSQATGRAVRNLEVTGRQGNDYHIPALTPMLDDSADSAGRTVGYPGPSTLVQDSMENLYHPRASNLFNSYHSSDERTLRDSVST